MRAVLFLAACLGLTAGSTSEKKIVCFFTSGVMHTRFIDTTLCTHVVYCCGKVRGGDVQITHPSEDIPDNWGKDGYGRVNALRRRNPTLKTMIGLGGALEEFIKCSHTVPRSTCPTTLADNIVKFTKHWNFDGVAILWRFENREPNLPEDQSSIIELLKTLRTRCDQEGLILSCRVDGEILTSEFYNIPEISEYVDFINVIPTTSGNGDKTKINAPLQALFNDSKVDKAKSVEASVIHWLSRGVPRNKVTIAVAALGSTFILSNPSENGVGAPVKGPGATGPLTNEPGLLAYNEICDLQKSGDWSIVFDEKHRAWYTFKGDQWISYDNVKSTREKAELIVRLNLGGAMVLPVHGDDYKGVCSEKYPLLQTLHAVFHGDLVAEESVHTSSTSRCRELGYASDPHSCGLIMCLPNATDGYEQHNFQCGPGNCYNPLIGSVRADNVDVNFFICNN